MNRLILNRSTLNRFTLTRLRAIWEAVRLPALARPITALFEPSERPMWQKGMAGLVVVLGYLLSPLCWWNDLVFNLPVAYGFGYLCSWVSSDWLLPGLISGYWLSNVVGILLMQFGALTVFQGQEQERNLKKQLLTGVVSSTIYTLLILALVQFQILDAPVFLPEETPIPFEAAISLPLSTLPGELE